MQLDDVANIAESREGVRRTVAGGLIEWRFHGRLVARQVDDTHVVIRTEFDYRDSIVSRFPTTFHVPSRYVGHTMVVAHIGGDVNAIEDAIEAAWDLQRRSG